MIPMSKYRVLWIDDKYKEMPLFVKKWSIDSDIDINLVGYEFAVDGMTAFDANPDSWDAVILDAQQLYADASEGTSLKGLRECRDFFKNHVKKPPFFIFTGDNKCMSDVDFAILMGQRIYKKGNEQDEADLVRDIHNACDANPERRMREKYAKEILICPKYAKEIVEVAIIIESGRTNNEKVFNAMRDIIEWVVKYGRLHGVFNQFVATPANASTFMPLIKKPDIVPPYVVSNFITCNEVVQNGSHGDDAGDSIKVKKHVKEGIAPHLIESTFNNLMVILDWCANLPNDEVTIAQYRELTKSIKIHQDSIEGVVQQDEGGNYFCREENGEKSCLIDYKYASDNSLLGKRVRIATMVANNKYPDESPYPYFTNRNII